MDSSPKPRRHTLNPTDPCGVSGEGAYLYLDMIANYSGIPTQIAMLVIVWPLSGYFHLLPITLFNIYLPILSIEFLEVSIASLTSLSILHKSTLSVAVYWDSDPTQVGNLDENLD